MPIIIAIIAIIAVIGLGGYFLQSQPTTSAPELTETTARPEDTTVPTETPVVNGNTSTEPTEAVPATEPTADSETFTARGEYLTPARTSHTIDVTLTLANGVVSDASIVYDGGAGFSNPHQERFDGAYKAQVIGKRLDQINLSRVGGASVTSRSFNEVIDQLEAQISA